MLFDTYNSCVRTSLYTLMFHYMLRPVLLPSILICKDCCFWYWFSKLSHPRASRFLYNLEECNFFSIYVGDNRHCFLFLLFPSCFARQISYHRRDVYKNIKVTKTCVNFVSSGNRMPCVSLWVSSNGCLVCSNTAPINHIL